MIAFDLLAVNCLFDRNVPGYDSTYIELSGRGGAVAAQRGLLKNCTFIANGHSLDTTMPIGGAVYKMVQPFGSTAPLRVQNCVFEGQVSPLFGGGVSVRHSLQQESTDASGVGNLAGDPMFVDPANGDYRLLAGSPAINAGDPNFDSAVAPSDLDGNPRVLCDRVDMGPYEFVGSLGDFHGDQTIDLFDFGAYDACQAGPGQQTFSELCNVFDMDCDGDVDLPDYGKLQVLFEQAYP